MAACVSGHRLVAATMADVVRMNTQATIRTTRS